MVIYVANASGETILQTGEASEDPEICTHGRSRHVIDVPSQISDEAAKAVAAEGSVTGLQIINPQQPSSSSSGGSTSLRLQTACSRSVSLGE